MNKRILILTIVLLVLNILAVYNFEALGKYVERFGATSPGTMVQLVSSHVPTKEDVIYYTKEYPKVVRREITDMTGNDPGDVALYPFQ
jgi:hypothetical protein